MLHTDWTILLHAPIFSHKWKLLCFAVHTLVDFLLCTFIKFGGNDQCSEISPLSVTLTDGILLFIVFCSLHSLDSAALLIRRSTFHTMCMTGCDRNCNGAVPPSVNMNLDLCIILSRSYILMNPITPLCCCNLIRPRCNTQVQGSGSWLSAGSEQLSITPSTPPSLHASLPGSAISWSGFITALGQIHRQTHDCSFPLKIHNYIYFDAYIYWKLILYW